MGLHHGRSVEPLLGAREVCPFQGEGDLGSACASGRRGADELAQLWLGDIHDLPGLESLGRRAAALGCDRELDHVEAIA